MNRHVAIGLSVLGIMLAEAGWHAWRRRSRSLPSRVAARLDVPVQEMLSESGDVKAVAYAHDDRVFRVEVFRLADGEADEQFWRRVSGVSFADRTRLADVMEQAVHEASDERPSR